MSKKNFPYKRILIKISGEVLGGNKLIGIDPDVSKSIAKKIKDIHDLGFEIGIVIGGGNIFRGLSASSKGMDRVPADYLGMLATIMNSVALQSDLELLNCETRVLSALSVTQLAEPYIRRKAQRHLEKKRIVIMAGGTGNPYFTTDTAAVLRAIEIKADVILKGTKVDGIYSSDPMKFSDAKKYDKITFKEAISNELRVMDMTAFTLCRENNIPIIIFNINKPDCLLNLIHAKEKGSLVTN